MKPAAEPLPANPTYSVSQDKKRNTYDVAFTWNVLDFGLSYVRAQQQADRFLINKESKLTYGADGSLKLYFAPEKPADAPEGNWLPTGGKPWSLTFRFSGPRGGVADGSYVLPPLERQ